MKKKKRAVTNRTTQEMLMRYFVDLRIIYQAKQKLLNFNTDRQIDQSQSEYCLRDIIRTRSREVAQRIKCIKREELTMRRCGVTCMTPKTLQNNKTNLPFLFMDVLHSMFQYFFLKNSNKKLRQRYPWRLKR